ncbi:MAG: septum site-determining protein MinC [Catonella sp.]|nr:septum site-determining protein MinC [Catonella sp.]MDY6357432.1 septum site-determining protein MinC [Catonella sp.]
MNNPVVIKANNFGLMVMLDPDMEFNALKDAIAKKFSESRSFFGDAEMALSFSGRKLSAAEEDELLTAILANVDFKVACVVDNDPEKEAQFKERLEQLERVKDISLAKIYKGSFRSGQMMEFDTGVVVLGDVNPGARIISTGSIVILGSLKGEAEAGSNGNENAFIIALDMRPIQLRIGSMIARSQEEEPVKTVRGSRQVEKAAVPKIAYADEGNIYIEELSKETLANINIPE